MRGGFWRAGIVGSRSMAASVIMMIMPADGVDTSPNVINIAGKRHRS